MKIFLAAITHKHGRPMYAGRTQEELLAKIADYCRQCWDELSDEACAEVEDRTLTDQETIDFYFSPENVGDHEYVEMSEDDLWPETPAEAADDIDDDDGCPHGDPDCTGDNGDCHDACSTFAERDALATKEI